MIITCKKEIPPRWVLFAILPWASFIYAWSTGNTGFFFSLKKFLDNPAALTFVLSMPTFISIFTGPILGFYSDRIWTRFGRRKPFITISLSGMTVCLALMPLMPNFWGLMGAYLCYSIFCDFNAMELLKQEVVPPHERGRATGAMMWLVNLSGIYFSFIALGRFEDVRFWAGLPITGELIIYISAGLLLSTMLLLIMLGFKELNQHSPSQGEHFSLSNFARALSDPELWPVYLLVVGSAALGAGLGPLGNLLYTEQWGYSKQEMGFNIAVGGTINIFLIGLLTIFADKLDRMKAYRTLICLSVGLNVIYFCYVTFILPDQRPSLVEIIVFGETSSIIGLLTNMVYYPLVYDYIRRNKLGTYSAGAGLVIRLTSIITLNGVGLFVWAYGTMFQPPAGEMTRLVLQGGENNKQAEVQSLLRSATWINPVTGEPVPPQSISANTWQSNGIVSKTGRGWEVRLRDANSEKLFEDKDKLNKEVSLLQSQEKILRDKSEIQRLKGNATCADDVDKEAAVKRSQIDALNAEMGTIKAELDKRASNFEQQVTRVLAKRLIQDGDQVLQAVIKPAVQITLPTKDKPDTSKLEKTLDTLRQQEPTVIDLRPVKLANDGYALELSVIAASGTNIDDKTVALHFHQKLQSIGGSYLRNILKQPDTALQTSRMPALQMDIMIVEESIDSYVSPITRIVNTVLTHFSPVARSDHKLLALARSLRLPGEINHVRIVPGSERKTITITALIPDSAPLTQNPGNAANDKITSLLGTANPTKLTSQAVQFYNRLEELAPAQNITVARPVLASSYSPMRYNYMCGYIWMFILGSLGITITLVFSHFEAKGYIHKRGLEEANAS